MGLLTHRQRRAISNASFLNEVGDVDSALFWRQEAVALGQAVIAVAKMKLEDV